MEPKTKPDFPIYVQKAFYRGLEDGVFTLLGLSGLSFLATRYSKFYRGFTNASKLFLILAGATSVGVVSAEYEMVTTYYRMKQSSPSIPPVSDVLRPHTLAGWLNVHQFGIATTALGASMALGGTYFLRERFLDMSTRIMNLRLFSQGLTLTVAVALLAAANYFREVAKDEESDGQVGPR